MSFEILRGDCIARMQEIPDNTFDSIVTDPPYELGFMGKSWDASGIAYNVAMWREALRVLKPGGHLLAFSGSRTYHRMTCAIEDAGFEIRDQIMWVYGSGFPKSLDVSKAIDKAAGAVRVATGETVRAGCRAARGGTEFVGSESIEAAKWKEITFPATDAARQWEGWGTALKPAHEPICVARKPLVGTVAANVLAHGTGALNIDGCRVDGGEVRKTSTGGMARKASPVFGAFANSEVTVMETTQGRWPANLIHDGSDEVVALFPETKARGNTGGSVGQGANADEVYAGGWKTMDCGERYNHDNGGSAARFFYCAKASKSDRGPGNTHPTVKPLALMQYLCRMVTPPGGRLLDPFAGSGSTIVAALREGFIATGIELMDEHVAIIESRVDNELYGDIL